MVKGGRAHQRADGSSAAAAGMDRRAWASLGRNICQGSADLERAELLDVRVTD